MTDIFIPYPDIDDPEFYDVLFRKKEFNKTMYKTEYRHNKTEDLCRKGEFKMQNHQEFVRNFLSSETPYNGIILFHGTGVGKTCAAIGTTEGLRDYVRPGGKIYVLAPETIRPNFLKELYDPAREEIEKEFHSLPGSYQCAGDNYYVKGISRATSRRDATNKLIKRYYEFMGPGQFANFVDIGLGADLPSHMTKPKIMNDDGTMVDIGDYFANSVIVVDEAHGIAGDDKKSKRKVLKEEQQKQEKQEKEQQDEEQEMELEDNELETNAKVKRATSKRSLLRVLIDTIIPACHAKGNKLKIILLTATPMKDNVRELADLLELLNINDGRISATDRAWRNDLFPKDMTVDHLQDPDRVRKIKKMARGYISYVKGNNPITFPIGKLPPAEYLYEPARLPNGKLKPMFGYRTTGDDALVDIAPLEYDVRLANNDPFKFNLVKCPMSIYQLKCYIGQIHGRNTKGGKKKTDSGDIRTRMVSNFVFPYKDGKSDLMSFIAGGQAPNLERTYGTSGFNAAFVKQEKMLDKNRKYVGFQINRDIWDLYGNFLSQDNEDYPLSMFSRKFDMFLDFVKGNNPGGISYAYSEFIKGGALIAALVLEANGFVRYTPGLQQQLDADGLPPDNIYEKYPQAHMLITRPEGRKPAKDFYLCSLCGKTYNECRAQDALASSTDKHKFHISTYIIVAGAYGGVSDIAEATADNIYGQKVKVILGTKKTGQGVDLKWVRQIHILDPWHNNTRIYQAIGRGLRHCSHADLPSHMRNVTIYKYSSVPDDEGLGIDLSQIKKIKLDDEINVSGVDLGLTYRDFFTETVDEHMYRRVVRKDMLIKALERVCKEVAIDCELNRMRNYFPEFDKDYSRECDYTLCKYDCDGLITPIKYIRRIRKHQNGQWYIIDDQDTVVQEQNLTSIPHLMEKVIDQNVTNNQELWDNLKARHMILPEAEYEDMLVDVPLIDVDESTYDIYFSLPQIDRAIKIITRLYQRYEALALDKIIYMVNRQDGNLEKQYIYMALDKLIGKPPRVAPVTIIDKYGRRGYIMYHNGFYIYQPNELHDTRIPMHYRQRPLQFKRRYYNMQILAPKEVKKVIDKVAQTDAGKINRELAAIRARRPESSITYIYKLYTQLNKYTPAEHKMLIETLILNMFDESVKLKDINAADAYILEYYLKTGLMLFSDWKPKESGTPVDIIPLISDMKRTNKRGIIHFLTSGDVRKFLYDPTKKWYWRSMDDGDLDYYKSARSTSAVEDLVCPSAPGLNGVSRGLIKIFPLLNQKEDEGFYSFNSTSKVSRDNRVLVKSGTEYIALLNRAVRNLQSGYPSHKEMAKINFKIIDQSHKQAVTTKAGNESMRTTLTGLACASGTVARNKVSLQKLIDTMKEKYDQYIAPFEELSLDDYAGLFKISVGLNKYNVCTKIEHICILLDYYQVDGVKWYLTPLETEIYRPRKS